MYVSVEEIKRHLNIDYEEDDQYLVDLIESAEAAVGKYIQQPLSELEDEGGNIPSDLKMAIRLMVDGFYANRGPAGFAASSEIPYGLTFLLVQHRKLS